MLLTVTESIITEPDMNWETSRLQYDSALEGCGVGSHIDPDVAGLFIDDEGLYSVSEGLQALLPAGLVLICRDEERWR